MSRMVKFIDSAEARATDLQILEVILYLADGDETEADRMWRSPTNLELIDIFVMLTERQLDPESLRWGPLGYLWSRGLQELM
jgi:hypothetical protein